MLMLNQRQMLTFKLCVGLALFFAATAIAGDAPDAFTLEGEAVDEAFPGGESPEGEHPGGRTHERPTEECPLEVMANTQIFVEGLDDFLEVRCTVKKLPGETYTISQIKLVKSGEDISSVTPGGGAQSLNGESNMGVDGNLNDDGDDQGYLSVSWWKPNSNQAGKYKCVAEVLERQKPFTKEVKVGRKSPQVSDILPILEELQQKQSELEDKLVKVSGCCRKPRYKPHIENGWLGCNNFDGQFISFTEEYQDIPLVIMTPYQMDFRADLNLRWRFRPTSVSTTGFIMECGTWANTFLSNNTVLSWYSFGQ